jgi:1-acyl-sn-glycerol-3-phosphate acyltransferase
VITATRFLVSVVALTCWYGGRIIWQALRGVRHVPGGVYDQLNRGWAGGMMRWNRVRATLEGLERLEPGQPYVYVANHVSFIDIWVLLERLPGSIRFVYKKELGAVPVFGQAMAACGHIAIDRKNRGSAFAAYDVAAGAVRAGTSAMVFAEGTRSRDGRLMPFKKGPFVLAVAAQVPIVPVAILGAFEAMPKGRLSVRPVPVVVRIGEPIATVGLSYEDRDRLSHQCRDAILAMGGGGKR